MQYAKLEVDIEICHVPHRIPRFTEMCVCGSQPVTARAAGRCCPYHTYASLPSDIQRSRDGSGKKGTEELEQDRYKARRVLPRRQYH